MTSVSARTAGVVVALYFAYELVAGMARQLTQIGVLLAQHTDTAMVVLSWAGIVLAPLPYVVAGFALFWLWPVKHARNNVVVAVIVRAALASAAGAVLSWIIGAISATTVSGGWFTSMPREYSFPEWFFGQAPSMLVGGIFQNFPVLTLAALVAALLFRRLLPNGHSESLEVTKRE